MPLYKVTLSDYKQLYVEAEDWNDASDKAMAKVEDMPRRVEDCEGSLLMSALLDPYIVTIDFLTVEVVR